MGILVIADHDHSQISAYTLNVLSAAKQMDAGPIDVLVCGHNAQGAADSATKAEGVAQVFLAEHEGFDEFIAENLTPVIVSLIKDKSYTHVLAAANSTGKNVMPRVAALMDAQQISDIIAVESADTFRRPVYAGNAIATVQSSDSTKIITVRPTAFDAVAAEGGSASVETLSVTGISDKATFVRKDVSVSERPELGTANVVISGGRGLGSAENFNIIEALADKLNGAIGASRAAVDAGFISNDCQVGQTGKIVAPNLYIAAGISGAIQHLAGMKDSKVIVAVNKDPDAPIFQVADYGIVGDLFEIIPELTQKI